MPPGKRKGPLPPQQALFLFGGCSRKGRFFRHTAQGQRKCSTPPPARTCAVLSMSTSEASCHRRDLSRAATRRELPGVQPPRTCAGLSMSTSEASCHRRDLSRAATRRELPGVQPPRTCAGLSMSTSDSELPKAQIENPGTGRGRALAARTGAAFSRRPKARLDSGGTPPRSDSPGTGPADEKTENFTFAPFLPLPFLHPSPADRRPSAPGCGAPPRASPHTSPAAPGFSAAAAGGTSGYTP